MFNHLLWGVVYARGEEAQHRRKQQDRRCCLGHVLHEIGFEGVQARRSVGKRGLGGVWRLRDGRWAFHRVFWGLVCVEGVEMGGGCSTMSSWASFAQKGQQGGLLVQLLLLLCVSS